MSSAAVLIGALRVICSPNCRMYSPTREALFFVFHANRAAKLQGMHTSYFFELPEMKRAEFANSVDLHEVTHNEPPDLYLHCLPSSL